MGSQIAMEKQEAKKNIPNIPAKDEFTTIMHNTMNLSEEEDQRQRTFTALRILKKKIFPRERTLNLYRVSETDIKRFESEWLSLQP